MSKEERFKYYEGQLLSTIDVQNLRRVFKAFEEENKELRGLIQVSEDKYRELLVDNALLKNKH